jgi:hypothetical protein
LVEPTWFHQSLVTSTGGSAVRTLADRAADAINVKDYGAAGVGGVDYTTQIQAAIDAAELVNGVVFFPPGTYYHGGLTVTPPVTLRGSGMRSSILFLKSGSNTHSITVDYVATGPFYFPQHCVIEDLEVQGNRTNQTGGHLIELTAAAFGSGTDYGLSVYMRNCYLTSGKEHGINVGANRGYGILENVEIEACDGDGIRLGTTGDWRLDCCDIGSCGGYGINDVGGYAVVIENTNVYSNGLIGCRVQPTAQDIVLSNCNFDRNGTNGVSLEGDGANFYPRVVSGCHFTQNSLSASGAHSDILVYNSKGGTILGNRFSRHATSQPKYLIEFTGTNDGTIFSLNDYGRGVAPWVTALTNDFSKLILAGDRTSYLGLNTNADTWSMVLGAAEVWRANSTKHRLFKRVDIEGTAPVLFLNETDGAADNRLWRIDADAQTLRGFAVNDAESTLGQWLAVNRGGAVISNVVLSAVGAERFRVDGTGASVTGGLTITGATTGPSFVGALTGNATTATTLSAGADRTKLDGIAAGATVNSTDAALRDRTTHTGAQAISTVTGLQSALDAKAPLAAPAFTGTVTAPSLQVTGAASGVEGGQVDLRAATGNLFGDVAVDNYDGAFRAYNTTLGHAFKVQADQTGLYWSAPDTGTMRAVYHTGSVLANAADDTAAAAAGVAVGALYHNAGAVRVRLV